MAAVRNQGLPEKVIQSPYPYILHFFKLESVSSTVVGYQDQDYYLSIIRIGKVYTYSDHISYKILCDLYQ